MKRFKTYFAVFAAALIITASICSAGVSAEETRINSAYEELEQLFYNCPSRTSGTTDGDGAEEYIAARFAALGYTGDANLSLPFSDKNPFEENKGFAAKNIVAFKDAPNTSKSVIISAYYDNCARINVGNRTVGGDGTYSSGTGIAVLLDTAKKLKNVNLGFDVYFAAFAAGEFGSLGANHFISDYFKNDLSEVVLAIDLNMAVGGEFQYIYSDETKTRHGDYFYAGAKEAGFDFKPVPDYKKQALLVRSKESDLPYYHVGVSGHNQLFIERGVPSLKFLSLNWEDYRKLGVSEYSGKNNVLQTDEDTLQNLLIRFGGDQNGRNEISARLEQVSDTVVGTLLKDDFLSVMELSKSEGRSYDGYIGVRWDIIWLVVKILLIVGGIVTLVLLGARYKKNHPPQATVIITPPEQKRENPFDELKGDGSGSGGDIFDGFGF